VNDMDWSIDEYLAFIKHLLKQAEEDSFVDD